MGQAIGVIIAAVVGYFVYQDASKRGMNAVLWGVGSFLLCIVFLPLYLIMRKPLVVAGGDVMYPPAGAPPAASPAKLCAACGKYYEGNPTFCPFCGAPQQSHLT